jgi:hypothetical protein
MKYNLIATECVEWKRVVENTEPTLDDYEGSFWEDFIAIFSKPENFDKVIVINLDDSNFPPKAARYKFASDEVCRIFENVNVLKDDEDLLITESTFAYMNVLFITKPGVTILEDVLRTGYYAPVEVYDFEDEETVKLYNFNEDYKRFLSKSNRNKFDIDDNMIAYIMKSLELAGVRKDQRIYILTHDWYEFYELQYKDSGQPLPEIGIIDYSQYSQYWKKWIRPDAEVKEIRLDYWRLTPLMYIFFPNKMKGIENCSKRYAIVEHNHPITEGGEPVIHYHVEWGRKPKDKQHTLLGEFRLPMEFDKFWEAAHKIYKQEGFAGLQNWDTYK